MRGEQAQELARGPLMLPDGRDERDQRLAYRVPGYDGGGLLLPALQVEASKRPRRPRERRLGAGHPTYEVRHPNRGGNGYAATIGERGGDRIQQPTEDLTRHSGEPLLEVALRGVFGDRRQFH